MRKTNTITMQHRKPLVRNLLLVDGISRSGKFLLANLLGGIKDVEPPQYHGLLEHIPVLEKFGFIDRKVAGIILRNEIDFRAYEMMIGRNLNQRTSDKSSIYNVPRHKDYLKRSAQEDIKKLLDDANTKKPYHMFVSHELMPHIRIYFEVFPHVRVLSLKRSPVDLVSSWYKRGLQKRLAKDPTLFTIPFMRQGRSIQWFTPSSREFFRASDMDKIILLIENIMKMYRTRYDRLPGAYKKKIRFIYFEDMISRPLEVTEGMSRFLGKKILPEITGVMKREGLPNKKYGLKKSEKLSEIKKLASPKLYGRLLSMEERYLKEYTSRSKT